MYTSVAYQVEKLRRSSGLRSELLSVSFIVNLLKRLIMEHDMILNPV